MNGQALAHTESSVPGAPDERPTEISISGVSVEYAGRTAVSDLDLDVQTGEVLCLVGSSGCGKTTLLQLMAGLRSPTAGSVVVRGSAITGPGPDRTMVFQEDAVFPWMTVRKNIEYGLRLQRRSKEDRAQRAAEITELVGLAGTEHLFPRQLSGGMRKRVDLARALAVEPETLLMDEPYAALDMMTKERLQVELLRIYDRERMTVVFVTHDLEEALFLGDRVFVMRPPPSRDVAMVQVPFARPRPPEIKRSSAFQKLRGELTAILAGPE